MSFTLTMQRKERLSMLQINFRTLIDPESAQNVPMKSRRERLKEIDFLCFSTPVGIDEPTNGCEKAEGKCPVEKCIECAAVSSTR